jgi:ribonuclease VapC
MVVDASAIIAVLAEEPKSSEVVMALESHRGPFVVSPLTVFEAALGLARSRIGRRRLATRKDIATALTAVLKFPEALSAEEIAVSSQLRRKAEAAARFGRVVSHAADLNFGDCFAYACARKRGASLLFVGNDFTRTDIESALTDPRPAR